MAPSGNPSEPPESRTDPLKICATWSDPSKTCGTLIASWTASAAAAPAWSSLKTPKPISSEAPKPSWELTSLPPEPEALATLTWSLEPTSSRHLHVQTSR